MKILSETLKKIKLNKAKRTFFEILIGGLLGTMGKKNFRNLSRYTEIDEHTFGRQMAKSFDFIGLNTELIKEAFDGSKMTVASQDSTFVPKSGKKTNGLGYCWNGTQGNVEKGLELDVIAITKVEENRSAFTISAEQVLANPLSKSKKKTNEKNVFSKIDAAVEHVKKTIKQLQFFNIKHMVVDAFYTKIKYVNGVVELGLDVIGKLRKDARIRRIYEGSQKSRGRTREFDLGNIKNEDFEKSPAIKIVEKGIELRFCIGYSESLKRKIKIVRISKITNKHETVALLFSTDLKLEVMQIYLCYTSRFQIEFVFRDAKNFTGLNDCQSRDKKRLHYHFNASLTALNMVKVQDYKILKNENKSQPFSMASWTRKYTVKIVLNRFLSKFDLNQTLIKSHPDFESVLSLGKINFKN
jgi:hypothetical protein